MATAGAVEDAITCCICFDVYRDPHALPCLHTLCKPCIDELAVGGRVECPECREISDVRKIRKDFKTQSLIDAHNGKGGGSGGDGNGMEEVCGMCRETGKVVNSHCKECEHFMCTSCEKIHKAIKVCRGHTVNAVKDLFQIAQSKLMACVDQWKMEKNKITIKSREIEFSVKNVKGEAEKQIQVTNKHFDKLIHDLEKKRSALVNEIRKANEVSVQGLRKNKNVYDQLSREIQSKIDMLQEVINGKHVGTMNDMVDDIDESLKDQILQLTKQVDMWNVPGVLPVEVQIEKNVHSIDAGINLRRTSEFDFGSGERSILLYSDYSKLKTNEYHVNGSQNCNANIHRICTIQNNLWCAAYTDGIQVYDLDMQLIKTIIHKNYSHINGLAEWRGDIIVACSNNKGLHQIAESGNYVQKIVFGGFADVCSNGQSIYGLKFHGIQQQIMIVILTNENKKWTEKDQILLKTHKLNINDKLFVNTRSLFISSYNENCIQKYSLEGELQQTFGCGGTWSRVLTNPVISGVDVYDNLLVTDKGNRQLKVYCNEEQTWHVVPVELDSKPWDAVMDENNIWVLNRRYPSQILKFTKI